jgi:hypothetical protein
VSFLRVDISKVDVTYLLFKEKEDFQRDIIQRAHRCPPEINIR